MLGYSTEGVLHNSSTLLTELPQTEALSYFSISFSINLFFFVWKKTIDPISFRKIFRSNWCSTHTWNLPDNVPERAALRLFKARRPTATGIVNVLSLVPYNRHTTQASNAKKFEAPGKSVWEGSEPKRETYMPLIWKLFILAPSFPMLAQIQHLHIRRVIWERRAVDARRIVCTH